MSEFSDSYHIRTEDPKGVRRHLKQAGLAGLTFGPSNGWLTFVPYEEGEAYRRLAFGEEFALHLSRLLSAPVLHYCLGEDHGWGFALAEPGEPLNRFAAAWDPEPAVEQEQLNLERLEPFADAASLAALLRRFDAATAYRNRPAYQFAEMLRLPAYKRLSPRLAQEHTEDMIRQGGRDLGGKPPAAAERLSLPSRRTIELPRADLSAREAFDLVTPLVRGLNAAWRLQSVFGGGRLQRSGRLEPGFGVWQLRYLGADDPNGDTLIVSLYFNGNLSFEGLPAFGPTTCDRGELQLLEDNWRDSSEIADIVSAEPCPDGIEEDHSISMSLRPIDGARLVWEVRRTSVSRSSVLTMASHVLAVDAVTGAVLVESFDLRENGKVLEARRREGGDWQSLSTGGAGA
jgi:hypothetical protein